MSEAPNPNHFTFSLSELLHWAWVFIIVPLFGWVWHTDRKVVSLKEQVMNDKRNHEKDMAGAKETTERIEKKVDKIIEHLLGNH